MKIHWRGFAMLAAQLKNKRKVCRNGHRTPAGAKMLSVSVAQSTQADAADAPRQYQTRKRTAASRLRYHRNARLPARQGLCLLFSNGMQSLFGGARTPTTVCSNSLTLRFASPTASGTGDVEKIFFPLLPERFFKIIPYFCKNI